MQCHCAVRGMALGMNGSMASALLPERAYTEVCIALTL